MKTDSLSTMSMQDFFDTCDRRLRNVAEILNIPQTNRNVHDFIINNYSRFIVIHVPPPRDVFDIFDETTAAIGENWLWDNRTIYFVREADAIWFQLRWS